VPEHFDSTNFEIQGGMGVIVNVRRSQTVNFTGTVWDNTAAAPGEHQPVLRPSDWYLKMSSVPNRYLPNRHLPTRR